jgi:hypothetical protein
MLFKRSEQTQHGLIHEEEEEEEGEDDDDIRCNLFNLFMNLKFLT